MDSLFPGPVKSRFVPCMSIFCGASQSVVFPPRCCAGQLHLILILSARLPCQRASCLKTVCVAWFQQRVGEPGAWHPSRTHLQKIFWRKTRATTADYCDMLGVSLLAAFVMTQLNGNNSLCTILLKAAVPLLCFQGPV